MKILFIPSYPVWPMIGREADLIKQITNRNDVKIKILLCNKTAEYCPANSFKFKGYTKSELVCKHCIQKRDNTYNLIGINDNNKVIFDEFNFLNNKNTKIIYKLEKKLIKNDYILNSIKYDLDKLDKYLYNTICGTLISVFHGSEKLFSFEKKLILNVFRETLTTYYSSENHFQKWKPDEIYLFNGRVARFQPFLRIAKKRLSKKSIFVYEYPRHTHEGLYIVTGNLPHDAKNTSKQMKLFSNKIQTIVSKKKMKLYCDNYIKNILSNKFHKVEQQLFHMKIKDNKLPNNFNKNDYNIAIFLTSEHERAYLNEFTENFPFKRQVDAVKYIADNLPNKYRKKLIKIYLRLHPGDLATKNETLKELNNHKYRNLIVIPPDDNIDSHYLGLNSNLTITTGSSMAANLTYCKKKVINIGASLAESFKIYNHIYGKKELLNTILHDIKNNRNILKKINIDETILYLYSRSKFNSKSVYFKSKNFRDERFVIRGKSYNLRSSFFINYLYLLFRIIGKIIPYYKGSFLKKSINEYYVNDR